MRPVLPWNGQAYAATASCMDKKLCDVPLYPGLQEVSCSYISGRQLQNFAEKAVLLISVCIHHSRSVRGLVGQHANQRGSVLASGNKQQISQLACSTATKVMSIIRGMSS